MLHLRGFTVLAAMAVAACESPQPPGLCGSMPQQTITVGETAVVDMCFDDPNDDVLTFKVYSSDPEIATATAVGSAVTATARSPGNALVTMIATDPTGLKAQQSFGVLVPNRPPVAIGEIADREVMVGDSVVLDVSHYFNEPDVQALSYTADVSDSTRLATSTDGATVTAVAIAKGTVVVTVTATDPGGLSAVQSFRVTVPNRPPVPVDSISAREIMVGRVDTIDAAPFFSDPDGDPLVFSAEASDRGVAALSVDASNLVVAALAKGEAVVTVTATDDEGLSALQRFQVTVPNRPPVAVDTIPSLMLYKDDSVTVDLTGYFSDPDGDALLFTAATSVPGIAAATVTDGAVTVTALAQGEATVTITASDPEGLQAQRAFQVTVPNRAPEVTGAIQPQSVVIGRTVTLTLTDYFSDPDGDALAFAATTSDEVVVTTEISERLLTVAAVGRGDAEVSVLAMDPGGLEAMQTFSVTVPNQRPVATGRIPSQSVHAGRMATLDLRRYFNDLDGDTLVYTAEISLDGIARVAVDGHRLTIRARERGEATVRVTATDPDGLSVTQSFALTVPNRRPLAVGTIPDFTLRVGSTWTITARGYFRDPDGDDLTYGAESSAVGVATATQSDGRVLVTGVGVGTADITITARDPDGRSGTQTFSVTVTSAGGGGGGGGGGGSGAPVVDLGISAQTLAAVEVQKTWDLANHFSDPNGDALTYDARSTAPANVLAEVSGSVLTITAAGMGTATIIASATDPGGRSASLRFRVTVGQSGGTDNRAPTFDTEIPDQVLTVGDTPSWDLADYFSDPDDDALEYSAGSFNTDVATAAMSGSTLTITAVSAGRAILHAGAEDPEGLTATMGIVVVVKADDGGGSGTNRAPTVLWHAPDQTLAVGKSRGGRVETVFSDPDDDLLTYSASSSNPSAVTADIFSWPLLPTVYSFEAVAVGTATVTLTATDPGGLKATMKFDVTAAILENRAPVVIATIPDLEVRVGQEKGITDLREYFDDPDGDSMTYTASSGTPAIVHAGRMGLKGFYVRGKAAGSATVTVTATDTEGASISQNITVTVTAN